ncbi:U6 small nuclear RNA (adenine-(43)-N(6))-methyltransferase isoform X2 [Daktulosphaira vitifoliae]|uniref:U6 small nuclear RNA (adenine-(43)-N(6))-methyltransferase isoform X2 n=1 Tax=Daktulosphaira vitifoliae TaxID=58002 RepID=UPI0021AA5FD1|nr:U6 small nuclear RNA (adenine-(43)-N(6))-methyltransferase isoform X2 [Daktulosphaira vitifoliae]
MPPHRFMHPRNLYKIRPNFKELAEEYPEFRKYATTTLNGKVTFDFENPDGLRVLTIILLKKDFGLDVDLPSGKLVPRIPLRLNYLLWIEDLLNLNNTNSFNTKGIDIGTGASCIYPLLAAKKFGWSMVGTDINKESIETALKNVVKNNLQCKINVLEVSEWDGLLPVKENEHYDFCMCNPPFHCQQTTCSDDEDNNTGSSCEIIYTTMVGYKSSLSPLKKELVNIGANSIAKATFFQGQTARWGLAWTFHSDIKLINFMPNIEFQKNSLKPPLSFSLSSTYNTDSAIYKLNELFSNLKLIVSPYKLLKNKDILYQADIKAFENTWHHQRRKRRMEQRLTDKRQKKENNMYNESEFNQSSEPHKDNKKILFEATLVLRTNDNIWIDMLHLNGDRNNSYQVFQLLKNLFA